MSSRPDFRLGVIEGFFGRQWSWQARHDYAGFLASIGCNSYIYAPKGDPWFRKHWHQPCPDSHLTQLVDLSARHRAAGIDFGIGLSPFELYLDFSAERRADLARKLEQINTIAPSTLCILFDDMIGDLHQLADIQAQIMDFVCAHSSADSFVMCPTYYSDDPILVRHFGAQPAHYLEDLGRLLDPAIALFWTGPQVISQQYPRAHLETVAEKIRRKPLLWDNYPVNDAKRLVGYLHLSPFTNREAQLTELCSGHLANPMNEPYLSQIPLYSLPRLYREQVSPSEALQHALKQLCSPKLAALLTEDAGLFETQGLDQLDAGKKSTLIERYAAFRDEPVAEEIVAWLQGEYAFDPSCLT
jgi:hyaluronoglucosaminidase